MKKPSFILTLIIHLMIVIRLGLLDNLSQIIFIFICCIIAGVMIKLLTNRNTDANDIAIGILFGSLAALLITMAYYLFLVIFFPG